MTRRMLAVGLVAFAIAGTACGQGGGTKVALQAPVSTSTTTTEAPNTTLADKDHPGTGATSSYDAAGTSDAPSGSYMYTSSTYTSTTTTTEPPTTTTTWPNGWTIQDINEFDGVITHSLGQSGYGSPPRQYVLCVEAAVIKNYTPADAPYMAVSHPRELADFIRYHCGTIADYAPSN